jgi:hypothetical protein
MEYNIPFDESFTTKKTDRKENEFASFYNSPVELLLNQLKDLSNLKRINIPLTF